MEEYQNSAPLKLGHALLSFLKPPAAIVEISTSTNLMLLLITVSLNSRHRLILRLGEAAILGKSASEPIQKVPVPWLLTPLYRRKLLL